MSQPSPASLRASLLLLLLALQAAAASVVEMTYSGEARDSGGALAYTEWHRVTTADGRLARSLTEYRTGEGTLIATLSADYSRSVSLPTYVFKDLRRGHREGLRWQDGGHVIFRQSAGGPEERAPLENKEHLFSCQGWHYFLVNRLELLEKEQITLNLVLPSELRPYPFVVKKLRSDGNEVAAELGLKNRLLRLLAPKFMLRYDKVTRRLMEFQGTSNILTREGRRQEVTLRYSYEAR